MKLPKLAVLNWVTLLVAVIGLYLSLWQYQQVGAIIFYGDDTVGHIEIINTLRNGTSSVSLGTPYLFEWVVSATSSLFNTNLLTTYSAWAILSLPLLILSVSFAAARIFNPVVGTLTAILLGLVSVQPVQTYQDGSIPNLYGIGVLFPLILLSAYESLRSTQLWRRLFFLVTALLLTIALFLTHHLSSLILLIVLGLTGILGTLWRFKQLPDRRWQALVPLLSVLLVLWVVLFVIQPPMVLRLISLVGAFQPSFPWFAFYDVSDKLPWDMARFATELSGLIVQAGILGLFLVVARSFFEKSISKAMLVLAVASWLLLYWIGATSEYSFEPDRLARDFALPGSMLAAYAIWYVSGLLWKHQKPALTAWLVVVAISAGYSAERRMQLATNTPKSVYTLQDQIIAETVAAYTGNVAVYSPNYFWSSLGQAQGYQFTQYLLPEEIQQAVNTTSEGCVVQLFYTIQIAGGDPDPAFATPINLPASYTTKSYEDSVRRLFLSCRGQDSIHATLNQKL